MSDTLKAAAWMVGSIVALTAMAVAGRAVSGELDTFEIMLYRSAIGLVLVLAAAGALGTLHQINRRRLGVQFLRNVSHFTGQNLWFYAITVAPLAQVFALEFTMPIWALVLAAFVLGEALTRQRVAVTVVGFAGILIITRPWASGLGPGVLAGAAAAVGFAGSVILTRLLTRTATVTCILFWLTLMQGGLALATAGWDLDVAWPSAALWPWIALIGAAGVIAHACLTRALLLAPATVVIPIDFVRLPAVAVVALILYAEPIDWHVLVGAAVIFAANYANLWSETRPKAAVAATVAR